ncbi:MAG: FHA domain-containing protein [Betaproteobacteria bacterium]
MGKLVLYLADGTLLHLPLHKERITIGRRADNDVCLPYPAVSGEHAAVVTILADSFLEDLGSTNGTLVNGRAAGKHFLNDRDQIDIGRQRLTYFADDDARVDPLPPDMVRNQLRGLNERVDPVRGTSAVPMASVNTGRPAFAGPGAALVGDDIEREITATPTPMSTPPVPERLPRMTAESYNESARRAGALAAEPAGMPSSTARVAPQPPLWPAKSSSTARVSPQPPIRPSTPPRATFTGDAPLPRTAPGATADPDPLSRTMPLGARAVTPAPDAPVHAPKVPSVRVLSGPSTGRSVPFPNDQLSVGRVGMQVAVVRKTADGFRLIPIEGAEPPRINGAPVAADGSPLHPGDTFEVAGVRLELSAG